MSRFVVFVRHGESAWNKDNRFCGWVDVPLSDRGVKEATAAAGSLSLFQDEHGVEIKIAFTSALQRAHQTTQIILKKAGVGDAEILEDWRLNERHYGALTGQNKTEMVRIHGLDQVKIWRRSFDVPPPPIKPGHSFYDEIRQNPSLKAVPQESFPNCESLKDLLSRTIPYWKTVMCPMIRSLPNDKLGALVVAHGTSLRGIVKHLDKISDEQIKDLNIPTGIPFVYELDAETLEPKHARRYLADEEVVSKAVNKVKNIPGT